MVTFILCMQACHSRQASDKPPALGVKFNLLKAFMGCIVDIIFFIGGIFLMSFSFFTIICGIFSRWEIENQTYDVDCKIGWRFPYGNCKIGWRDPRPGFPRFWAPDCLGLKREAHAPLGCLENGWFE